MTPEKFRQALRGRINSSWILTISLLALHVWAKESIRREQVERTADAVIEKLKQSDEERRATALRTLKDTLNTSGFTHSYRPTAEEVLRARRVEESSEDDAQGGDQ